MMESGVGEEWHGLVQVMVAERRSYVQHAEQGEARKPGMVAGNI